MVGAAGSRPKAYLVAVVVAVLAALMSLTAAQAVISPSTFEAHDGDLLAGNNGGTKDWSNIGVVPVNDATTGANDDSLKGAEDDTTVGSTSGNVQPNKSDLLNFRIARESVGGTDFLYLAWERIPENQGTVNIDFELNQRTQGAVPAPTSSGAPWNLDRAAGDILITFDLAQGGITPTLAMLTWVTGAGDDCYANGSNPPCWGDRMVLNPTTTPAAEASVGVTPGTDMIYFGEAAINLVTSGIFKTGTCTNFGSAYVKSRSSDSFPAQLSDFIKPVEVAINNCGDLTIVKDSGDADATFTFDVDCSDDAFDRSNLSVTTVGGDGQQTIADIPNGTTCTVSEDEKDGWTLDTTSPTGGEVTIDGDKTVTFTNSRDTGKIVVNKTANGGDGVFTFSVDCTGVAGYPITLTIDTATASSDETPSDIPTGSNCTVKENPTTGWAVQGSATRAVTVDEATETVSFVNDRLYGAITVTKQAAGGNGTFSFTVDCTDVDGYPRTLSVTTTNGTGSASTPQDIPTGTDCTVTETAQPGVWTIVGDAEQDVVVDSASESVVFSNVRNVGTLTVVVKTEGGNGTFAYDVDCDGSLFDADGSITTTAGTGSSPTIGSIPTGTSCTATQTPQPGWTLTSASPQSVVIDGDEVITFVNTRNVNSITVDKSASVTSATEGDAVTFTYVVRSPGPDALSSVNVVDDRCSQVVYRTGDIDGDGRLDPGELWTYTCQAAANSSTPTNVATATGIDPGGARVEATDAVTITVVAPQVIVRPVQVQGVRLPRTGSDIADWAMLGGSLMLLGLSLLFVTRQRRTA